MPKKPFSLAASVLIRDGAGRVLLLKRAADDPINPGKWDLPGGTLDPGETFDRALRREAREGTGMLVTHRHVAGAGELDLPMKRVVYLVMACDADGTEVSLSPEHEAYAWVVPEVAAMDLAEQFRGLFEGGGGEQGETRQLPPAWEAIPPAPHRKVPERDRHAKERLARVEKEGFPDGASPLDGETAEERGDEKRPGCHGNEGRAEEEDDPVVLSGMKEPSGSLRQGVVPPFPGALVGHEISVGEDGKVLMDGRPGKIEPVGEFAHRHGPGIKRFEDGDPGVGGESGDVVPVECDLYHVEISPAMGLAGNDPVFFCRNR